MQNLKDRNYELGFLPDEKNNRYWQIKLKRGNWSSIIVEHEIIRTLFNSIKQILGIVFFLILLVPISIIAVIISFVIKEEIRQDKKRDRRTESALKAYKKLMGVYPIRVYSPVTKSLEIGLINDYSLTPPSLEIAIGDGYLSSLIFQEKNYKLTIGSDLIYETILSSQKYKHIDKLAIFDAEAIPLPDNCLNTVIMNNLMHHLPSRKKALSEIERALKPGGLFIFTDNLYGWVSYTFDSRLLRFLRLGLIAKKLEAFKLHLFAQKLLTSSSYWNELVKESQMEVLVNKEFVSRKTMTISSIFEYLNLLQGQPTRKPMRTILKIGPLKKFFDKRFEKIIRYLIINDEYLLKNGQGAYLFVVLRKKQINTKNDAKINDPKYICLKCRNNLLLENDKFICEKCGQIYSIRKDIPIFLPYQEQLSGFNDYLEVTEKKETREYIT